MEQIGAEQITSQSPLHPRPLSTTLVFAVCLFLFRTPVYLMASSVWKFFKKSGKYDGPGGGDEVTCLLCGDVKRQLRGSTSNMKKHLERRHRREWLDEVG